MKKYKLIKEYPGSPKLGHIWEMYDNYKGDYHKQPEFWEEIIEPTKVEKDYQILSLTIHDSRLSDMTGYGSEYIEALLKDRLNKIHSVKRLSDGEIFTIDDNCEYGIITNIFITREGYCMTGTKTSPYSCNILYLKHKKQPLFKTEDGVDIFEGDWYFELITPDFYLKSSVWNILKSKGRDNINYDQNYNKLHGRIWFSTEEKAQEYVDLHKPKYSLNDIRNIFDSDVLISKTYLTQSLKQLNK